MARIEFTELLSLEHAGWDALCEGRGGRFYGDLLTEHAVMVLVNGMVLDRDAVAPVLNESPPWSAYRLDDARLVPTGTDAAALVYTATASRDGEPGPFTALMSSHYRWLDGRIRMTLYQQTAITHEALRSRGPLSGAGQAVKARPVSRS